MILGFREIRILDEDGEATGGYLLPWGTPDDVVDALVTSLKEIT